MRDLEYATKVRKEAVRATKNRKRTNDIHDPEYCAFYEGKLFGEMMTLNGQRQHRIDGPEKFYNDPTLINSVKALEGPSAAERTALENALGWLTEDHGDNEYREAYCKKMAIKSLKEIIDASEETKSE